MYVCVFCCLKQIVVLEKDVSCLELGQPIYLSEAGIFSFSCRAAIIQHLRTRLYKFSVQTYIRLVFFFGYICAKAYAF